jgi:hypothetical protein
MQSIGFIAPLLPGMTETDRSAMISCWRGQRQEASARASYGLPQRASAVTSARVSAASADHGPVCHAPRPQRRKVGPLESASQPSNNRRSRWVQARATLGVAAAGRGSPEGSSTIREPGVPEGPPTMREPGISRSRRVPSSSIVVSQAGLLRAGGGSLSSGSGHDAEDLIEVVEEPQDPRQARTWRLQR